MDKEKIIKEKVKYILRKLIIQGKPSSYYYFQDVKFYRKYKERVRLFKLNYD